MTELEKAKAYFNMRGIAAYIDGDQLYIITPDSNEFHVTVATSEVIYRAELYDESMKDIQS